jgi:hypothetical protein
MMTPNNTSKNDQDPTELKEMKSANENELGTCQPLLRNVGIEGEREGKVLRVFSSGRWLPRNQG